MSPKRLIPLFAALLCGVVLSAAARAQTSIGVSVYGAFSGATTGNGVQESPSNAAGGLFELRHISNPIMGYEVTYAYNRANEAYRCTTSSCPIVTPAFVPANAHEVTVDWIPSIHIANLRPFGVLGAGLLLNQPANGQTNTSNSTRGVYVFGAGVDWGLLPHLGLRLQYRGSLYKSPDLSKLYTSTDAFTHTARPMAGLYFNF